VKDQQQEAGDNARQFQAGRDIELREEHHHHYGITEERALEIADELWAKNADRLADRAGRTYDDRAIRMTRAVIRLLVAADEGLLESFAEPRAQIPLLAAQRSYGETGDDDLAVVLARVVAELIQQEPRGHKERVLRQALECATAMTRQHLNVLSVIVNVAYRTFPSAINVEQIVAGYDSLLRPYYGDIPTEAIEYSYLNSLNVGSAEQISLEGYSPYMLLRRGNINAMYPGFAAEELPDGVLDLDLNGLIVQDPDSHDKGHLHPDYAAKWLTVPDWYAVSKGAPESDVEKELVKFVQSRLISQEELATRIRGLNPELADLLDILDRNGVLALKLNPVGMMLAAQEEMHRKPGQTSELLRFFEPSNRTNPAAE
jgi:hypothetical protein